LLSAIYFRSFNIDRDSHPYMANSRLLFMKSKHHAYKE
jgi:hypothetical protein